MRAWRPLSYVLATLRELVVALAVIAGFVLRPILRLRRLSLGDAAASVASPPAAEQAMGSGASPRVRTRREILTLVSVAMGGFAATIVAIPVIGALLAPLLRQQAPEWRSIGTVSDFQIGTTVAVTFEDPSPLSWAGVASQTAAWLRRESTDQFTAFAVNCTHLGCPVRWLPQADLFMCPCHGGVFYKDGSVAAGPPQRPLFLYPVRLRDGRVEILSGPVRVV